MSNELKDRIMTHQEAKSFLQPAIAEWQGNWADLGAGDGVYTLALAEILGPESMVYAVDTSADVFSIKGKRKSNQATILSMKADFTHQMNLPPLSGIIMANSLHYVTNQSVFLQKVKKYLQADAPLIIIEYDRKQANQWVPHPVPFDTLTALATAAGFSRVDRVAGRESIYGSEIYLAILWQG